jgi:hypothetical protein
MVLHFMSKSNKVVPKKARGRPATGRDPVTAIRLSENLRKTVDKWAAKQEGQPGRSEAIRRLLELGLSTKPTSNERVRHGRSLGLGAMAKIEPALAKAGRVARARELATEAIDKMGDPTANPEERR